MDSNSRIGPTAFAYLRSVLLIHSQREGEPTIIIWSEFVIKFRVEVLKN